MAEPADAPNTAPNQAEMKKRGQRNLAIALSLGAFIVLVFLATILRLGGSVAERGF